MRELTLVYDEGRAALFQQGKLAEYIVNPPEDGLSLGAICLARIAQTFPKQKRANCQLANGVMASFRMDDGGKLASGGLASGDLAYVTLSAMGRQNKPWQAEQGINRAGRLIVLHHGKQGVRLSHKAKGQIDEAVISAVSEALPEGWGAVLKRASIGAGIEAVTDEIRALLAPLAMPLHLDRLQTEPSYLYHGDDAKLMLSLAAPEAMMRYEDDEVTWHDIEDDARDACEREVVLSNGAVLSFEVTKALIAVDVDSAASKLAPLALAKAVAPEIMRLIRLASYSGVIVVDMPRLAYKDMAPVIDVMREAAADDVRHPDVLGISRAGLIELVVRHRLAPLASRLGGDVR